VVVDPAADDVVDAAAKLTGGIGIDIGIDAVGDVDRTVTSTFLAVRPGGRVVIAGVPPTGAEIRLPGGALVSDERSVSGCFIGSADPIRDVARLLGLWRTGRFDLAALVTGTTTLDDVPAIVSTGGTPGGIRTVVAVGAR
jgi:Zn-dependent alcohol dehydrogenase